MRESVTTYYSNIEDDENHRLKSWEHCYIQFNRVFNEGKLSITDKDYLSLHLAFYLASWGMYRGSSFILQKDYKVFYPVIELLYRKKDKFNDKVITQLLRNKDTDSIRVYVKDFLEFDEELTKLLKEIRNAVKGKVVASVSDTLRTKIILGAYGSIPAYDRLFRDGLRASEEFDLIQAYSENGVVKLLKFAKENIDDLNYIRGDIEKRNGIKYPYMKLIDMYFWQIGYELEEGKRK